ncbi:MAG TPA: PAS domain S-box protein [Dongiaceae bacterium]|nr:PAS domain S-box protein [Dongiaceae bacterium]
MVYLLAAVMTGAVMPLYLLLVFNPEGPPSIMIFLFPIILSGYLGGLGPGLLATAIATLETDYFLLTPYHSFVLDRSIDLLRLGAFVGVGLFSSGLSEALHRSRRRVEASERLQRVTLASIGDAVITTDNQGRVTFLNAVAEHLTGWPQAEALGQPLTAVFQIINHDTRQPVSNPVEKVLREGKIVGLANHTVLIARDGRELPIDDSAAPIQQPDGTICGVVLVFSDRSEQAAAEAARQRSEYLASQSRDTILLVRGSDRRILEGNAAAAEMYGYTHEELMQLKITDVLCELDEDLIVRRMDGAEGKGTLFETTHRRKDGTTFPVEVSLQSTTLGKDRVLVSVIRDITERRRSEETIRHIDELLQLTGEMAKVGGWEFDAATLQVTWTDEVARLHDLNPGKQMDVAKGVNYFIGESRQKVAAAIQAALKSATPYDLELELLTAKGVRKWVRAKGIPVTENGRVTKVKGIIQDITERKEAESALQESQALYHSLVEQVPVGIYRKDATGRFVFVNPVFCELRGLTADHFLGKLPEELPGSEKNIKLQGAEHHAHIMQTGETVEAMDEYHRGDGQVLYFHVVKTPVFDAAGKIIGTQGAVLDVTAHRLAEASTNRLAAAVEQAAEDILITDAAGKIEYVNPAFEHTTGYSRQEVLGQTPRLLKSGRHDAAYYQEMWATLTRGEVWFGHFINKKKDGTLIEEKATISPIRDASGKITNYVGVRRDVTREVALEAQLRHAQKMESVGQLAGGIAHDFNNLLTVIQGNSQLLLDPETTAAEAMEYSRQIFNASERAARLTRQLLLFSRRQTMQPVSLDLNRVVGQMLHMLQRTLGEDIALISNCAPDLPVIRADVGMIEQVVLNLAINSRDAMPSGGRLILTTSVEDFEAAQVRSLPQIAAGTFVVLTVTDTGCGIPAESLPHIFEPFYTTKEVGKGTGLGLATVYGIVEQHQGWIDVASAPGKGTTFRVYFPATNLPKMSGSSPPELSTLPRGTETILVAEDEPALRTIVVNTLRRCGYTILQAANGAEALQVWRAQKNAIQLLLTDIVMPGGLTGFDLAQQLQNEQPRLKIVYSSGYSDDLGGYRATLAEGENYLQKPYTPQTLARIVRRRLDAA